MRPSSLTAGLAPASDVAVVSAAVVVSAATRDTAASADNPDDNAAAGALTGGATVPDANGKICDSSSLRCWTRAVRS
jgi:hypothetical protein